LRVEPSGADQRKSVLRFVVEILKLNGADPPQILHTFSHSASSAHFIRETLKGLMHTPAWPAEANGFRIISENGIEEYRSESK
jgi:hypothetical protein